MHGGVLSNLGDFPFQAHLRILRANYHTIVKHHTRRFKNLGAMYYTCGAVLITNQHLLSAAHCIKMFDEGKSIYSINQIKTEVRVRLGTLTPTYNGTSIKASNNLEHPDYNPFDSWPQKNDIAIIWLPKSVTTNEYISPVLLPPHSKWDKDVYGKVGTVSGYGVSEENGNTLTPLLRHANVTIISHQGCRRTVQLVDSSHLCTSTESNRDDRPVTASTCTGDSGGPLVMRNSDDLLAKDKLILIGIVEGGSIPCGLSPSVFTRVTYYLDTFIRPNVPNI